MIKRAKKRIKILEDQIKEIEKEIDKVIKNNPEVKRKTEFLTSLVGVGTNSSNRYFSINGK
jgi:hypothetical protein